MTTLSRPSPPTSLIAASAERPGDDPIFALNAEAVARKKKGEDILNATIGALMEPDGTLAVMPSVFEAFRRVAPESAAGYAPISGPPRYLNAVIQSLYGDSALAKRSVAAATPGGTGAVHHAIVNFLEPGQKLLTTSYYWEPYAILAEHTRRGVETFPMFDESGAFHLAAFERALEKQLADQGRALVILNTPCHNPTGYSLDARELSRVAEILESASKRGVVTLLLDYAYAPFDPHGSPEPRGGDPHGSLEPRRGAPNASNEANGGDPLASRGESVSFQRWVERLTEKIAVLVAWTASKAFAQYGSRIGALVASHKDPAELTRIQNALGYSCRGTWSNCNHLGMLAITELFEDPELRRRSEEERGRLRALLAQRVDAFNRLASEAGLRYPRYEGGFFVAVFTKDAARCAARMREDGVYVVPLKGAVRVALCATPVDALPRLVRALKTGVEHAGG